MSLGHLSSSSTDANPYLGLNGVNRVLSFPPDCGGWGMPTSLSLLGVNPPVETSPGGSVLPGRLYLFSPLERIAVGGGATAFVRTILMARQTNSPSSQELAVPERGVLGPRQWGRGPWMGPGQAHSLGAARAQKRTGGVQEVYEEQSLSPAPRSFPLGSLEWPGIPPVTPQVSQVTCSGQSCLFPAAGSLAGEG